MEKNLHLHSIFLIKLQLYLKHLYWCCVVHFTPLLAEGHAMLCRIVVVVTAVGAVITVVSQLNIYRADDSGQLKNHDTLNDTPYL